MASSDDGYVLTRPQSVNSKQTMSRCHTTRNGTHECLSCAFEGLETPLVPDMVKRLLLTNDPPGDTIVPSILSSLDTALALTENVDKCIAAMQAILEQMKNTKDACTLAINQHKAAIHPIRSIPDDVLRTIFECHVISEMKMGAGAKDTLSSSFSPWTLSHVSRSWRALAISSSQLWSTIDLIPQEIQNESHRIFMVSKQALALHRSADCNLSICLTEKRKCRNSSMEQGIHLLLPTTRRWTYLKLSTVTTKSLLVAPLVGCSFEHLTELVWTFPFTVFHDQKIVSMFKTALNLRRLLIRGGGSIEIPWDRITVYSTDIFGILNLPKFTAVESLTLDLPNIPSSVESVMWRILLDKMFVSLSLPTIRSLSMIQTHGSYSFFLHISRLLHLPSLTSLSIISWEVPLPNFPGPLPHLRYLTLMSSAPLTEIHAFLDRYPSVTSFYAMNLHVLQLLPSILLPNLTSLCINGATLISEPLCVVEALEDRCNNKVPLVELRISGKEKVLQRVRDAISKINGLLERWDVICAKLKIIDER